MLRHGLSAPGMYSVFREKVLKIPDERLRRPQTIPIVDAAMSAASMFALKYPSMLQFVGDSRDPLIQHNLRSIFQVSRVPSDTAMREILDPIETRHFQDIFKSLFSLAQRGKALEGYTFYNGAYLISLDGTGFFSSHDIHCENCNVKNHRDGTKTFYHQMLAGVVIHPDRKEVIPLAPEPISLKDGSNKNDCERNASERFLRRLRREHPHLKIIITEDGLSSNAPHIRLMNELGFSFILGCKPGDHKALFDFVDQSEKLAGAYRQTFFDGNVTHEFRWQNGVPLNDSHPDLMVNFIEYWEKDSDGNVVQHFSWVTDIEINKDNLMQIMRGGRARWKVENETFNTLKNLGYNFEHNFGHGYQNLSNNLAVIMMLVFLIDQLQQICCLLFKKALERAERVSYLWRRMRNHFGLMKFKNWEEFLKALAYGVEVSFTINTS
jgi:hypothetical protein